MRRCCRPSQAVAKQFAAGPTFGFAQTKHAIWASSSNDFPAQLDLERDIMRECGRSHDYREGVAAFMGKACASLQAIESWVR